jgi:hypothetical protein
MTREQALREYGKGMLPQQYSSNLEYASQIQKEISVLDNQFRNIKNEYGGKVPEEVAAKLVEMNKHRQTLKSQLDAAKKDPTMVAPGSEEALNNFVRNPYGVQAQMLRNQDAKIWATNKAMTTEETSLKVNDWYVTQWENQQKWAMKRAEFAHDKEMEGIKAKNAQELEMLKATGMGEMMLGSDDTRNSETTPRQAQQNYINQKTEDLTRMATDLNMLKVAGNYNVDKTGAVVEKNLSPDFFFNLQTAIKEAEKQTLQGGVLTPQSQRILNDYAKRVGLSGYTGFANLMGAVYKGVKTNTGHPLGANARQVAGEVVNAFHEVNQVVTADQKFLASLATREGYEGKIGIVNGRYAIVDDPDGVLANMVANPQRWENATRVGNQQITLNYSDANKADYSPISNGLNLSTSAGTLVNGKFVPFSDTQLQAVRNILGNAGKENYKNMFDPNVTIRSTMVNGEKVVQMIIPAKRGGKENALQIAGLGLPEEVEGSINAGSSIVVNIPEARSRQIFNESVYNINGRFVKAPNVKSMLVEKQQNFDDGFGNELMTLKNTGKARIPLHYDVHGIDGTVFVDQSSGRLMLSVTKDGVSKTDYIGNMTISELTPNSAETLSRNIRGYVDQIVQNSERKIADNRTRIRSGVNSSWKNADDYYNID